MHALSLLALAAASLVSAGYDNTKEAALLTSQSIPFENGAYTIRNVLTNQSLQYSQSGQQMWPDNAPGAPITFNQHPELPYTRLSVGVGNIKCLSQQWGYDERGKGIGANHAGVLYACAVGDGAFLQSTLERTKQWWLFVPVSNSSLTSALDTDDVLDTVTGAAGGEVAPNASGCSKAQDWIRRHPQYVKGSVYNHLECASLLRADQLTRLGISAADIANASAGVSASASASVSVGGDDGVSADGYATFKLGLAKRAAANSFNGGVFSIIGLDHLLDMETRALTSKTITIEGSKAVDYEPWDATNAAQQWIVEAAN